MKRTGYITIVLLLHSLLLWSYDFSVDGIYYNITSKKDLTVEVTYKSDKFATYKGEVIIPLSVEYKKRTYRVTDIGAYAFCDCLELTSVTLLHTIMSIGKHAFSNCENLRSLSLPDSLKRIGHWAFFFAAN